jgi:PhoH-like ATPase
MKKSYVLDTNVLIENPESIRIFRNGEENEVFIPYTVLLELDRLKRRSDLSHIISEISRLMETEQYIHYLKISGHPYNISNDEIILLDILEGVATDNYGFERDQLILVSNDRLLRIRASLYDIQTQEFKSSKPFESESQLYTGFIEEGEPVAPNCFQWINNQLFYHGNQTFVLHENSPWDIVPRTVYQNCAIELMLDPRIDLVSVQSAAGYGKSFISLACAFHLTLQKPKNYDAIYIIKPTIEIGEKLGFLPGTIDEKIAPYIKPMMDLILKLHDRRAANALFVESNSHDSRLNSKKIQIVPLNYIRGMNIENAVVIIDECQNLTRHECRTILTRMGKNVKCFVLGDTNQVDHPYLNSSNNGLNWIVKLCKGQPNYGHMILRGGKSRGPITDMILKIGL